MKLYLDEMFPPRLPALLRARGIDAVSALDELPAGTLDEAHLVLAAQLGRSLVTKDLRDYRTLNTMFMAENRPHCGIVLVPKSINNDDYTALTNALVELCRIYPEGLPPYTILWLSSVPVP